MHTARNAVASSVPFQHPECDPPRAPPPCGPSRGCGGCHRLRPTGGTAYGMDLKTSTFGPSCPWTGPQSVVRTGEGLARARRSGRRNRRNGVINGTVPVVVRVVGGEVHAQAVQQDRSRNEAYHTW